MAASPKQQRIDPSSVEEGVTARRAPAGQGSQGQPGEAQPAKAQTAKAQPKKAQTPKKGRPTPKRPKAEPGDGVARDSGKAPAKGSGKPKVVVERPRKATARDWIAGARPQTLVLGIAPVVLGTAAASILMDAPWAHWVRALLCLVVAASLQIGVNFANDYSDGIRGTDAQRRGPQRLVGSGAAKPSTVRNVAFAFFGIAAVAGILLAWRSGQWWILAVGVVCIAAAWFYTGGKRPYGYSGLGELFVFVFFGLVATAGTMLVQVGEVSFEAWLLGAAAGLFACAVLMSNNLRDIEQDRTVGKRTLAVLVGPAVARVLYGLFMLLPYVILIWFVILYFNTGYTFFTLIAAVPAVLIAALARTTPEHLVVLRLSVLTALLYSLALGATIAF